MAEALVLEDEADGIEQTAVIVRNVLEGENRLRGWCNASCQLDDLIERLEGECLGRFDTNCS